MADLVAVDDQQEIKPAKVYLHVPPRVDAESYQAEVTDLSKFVNTIEAAGDEPVSVYINAQDAANAFLAVTRSIFESCSIDEGGWDEMLSADIPLESDAIALEYLHKFNYDVEKALFKLRCDLGHGKEFVAAMKLSDKVSSSSSISNFDASREAIVKGRSMFGAFVRPPRQLGHTNSGEESETKTVAQNVDRKERDKSISQLRRRWYGVYHAACAILGMKSIARSSQADSKDTDAGGTAGLEAYRAPGIQKSDLKVAQAILDDAAELAPFPNAAGEDLGDNMRKTLGELLTCVAAARQWSADMRDALKPAPTTAVASASLNDLREMLRDARSLVVVPHEDVSALRALMAEAKAIKRDAICVTARCNPELLDRLGLESRAFNGAVVAGSHITAKVPTAGVIVSTKPDRGSHIQQQTFRLNTGSPSTSHAVTTTGQRGGGGRQQVAKWRDDDDDGAANEDADDEAELQQGVTTAEKLSFEHLEGLVRRSRCLPMLPALHPHLPNLLKVLDHVTSIIARAEVLKACASICAVRKYRPACEENSAVEQANDSIAAIPSKSSLATSTVSNLRIPLTVARQLLGEIASLPVLLPAALASNVKSIVTAGEAWLAEANALFSSAEANSARAVSLRRVDVLITEGESLPFDFEEELKKLREKQSQAKVWLERLKNSFQAPMKTKSSARVVAQSSGSSGSSHFPVADPSVGSRAGVVDGRGKLCLADMKLLVEEGAVLLDENTDDAESGGGGGHRTKTRELTKAQNVVEVAEDWLGRVRELLIQSMEAKDEREGRDDDEEDEDGDDILDTLSELLEEAENMPVHMDEAQVLRGHLRAMEWARKARKLMPLPSQKSSSEANHTRSTDSAATVSLSQQKKISFAEASSLANEIKRIREELPKAVAKEFSVKSLPEEVYVLREMSDAEDWVANTKKNLQGSNVRKGTRLKRVVDILKAGVALPVDVGAKYLRALCAEIKTSHDWLSRHSAALRQLGVELEELGSLSALPPSFIEEVNKCLVGKTVRSSLSSVDDVQESQTEGQAQSQSQEALKDNFDADVADATAKARSGAKKKSAKKNAIALDASDSKEEAEEVMPIVTAPIPAVAVDETSTAEISLSVLERIVHSADSINAEFPELKFARDRYHLAKVWSQKVFEVVPSRIVKKHRAKEAMEPMPEGKNHRSTSLATLQNMLESASNMKMSFPIELVCLREAIDEAVAWQKCTSLELRILIERELTPIIAAYQRVAFEDISGLRLPFLKGMGCVSFDTVSDDSKALLVQAQMASAQAGKLAEATEEELWARLQDVRTLLETFRDSGAVMGVWVNACTETDIALNALEWLDRVRMILRTPDPEKKESKNDSIEWGDISRSSVEGVVQECDWLIAYESAERSTEEEAGCPAVFDEQYRYSPYLGAICHNSDDSDVADSWHALLFPHLKDRSYGELRNIDAPDSRQQRKSSRKESHQEGSGVATGIDAAEYPVDDALAMAAEESLDPAAEDNTLNESMDAAIPRSQRNKRKTPHYDSMPEPAKKRRSKRGSVSIATTSPSISVEVEPAAMKVEENVAANLDSNKPLEKLKRAYKRKVNAAQPPDSPIGISIEINVAGTDVPKKRSKKPRSAVGQVDELSSRLVEPASNGAGATVSVSTSSAAFSTVSPPASLLTRFKKLYSAASDTEANTSSSIRLPFPMVNLLDFWMRLLRLFQFRLLEAQVWAREAKSTRMRYEAALATMLQRFNPTTGAGLGVGAQPSVVRTCRLGLLNCLKAAKLRGLQISERLYLERLLAEASDWCKRATRVMNKDREAIKGLALDEFRDFVREGEKLAITEGMLGIGLPAGEDVRVVDELLQRESSDSCPSVSPADDYSKYAACPSVATLRAELKRGRAWYDKFTGTAIVAEGSDEMKALLEEADTLCVDVSEHIETIRQNMTMYCLCRQAYHGEMIGCDGCDEWYHVTCIGMTQAQVNKCDKFTCIRCSLVAAFTSTASRVAAVCNRWASPREVSTWRENRKSKLIKRRAKEEREAQRIDLDLVSVIRIFKSKISGQESEESTLEHTTTTVVETSVLSALAPTHRATFYAQLDELLDSLNIRSSGSGSDSDCDADIWQARQHVKRLREEIDATFARVDALILEEDLEREQLAIQTVLFSEIQSWFLVLQYIIWPRNEGDDLIGTPVRSVRISSIPMTGAIPSDLLLSPSMRLVMARAKETGIDHLEDVVFAMDSFRLMSWLYIAAHSLRKALRTSELRALMRLSQAVPPLFFTDHKFMKTLSGIHQRSSLWKARARKLCGSNWSSKSSAASSAFLLGANEDAGAEDASAYSSQPPPSQSQPQSQPSSSSASASNSRWVEATRLNNLLLEGGTVPISSRLKTLVTAAFVRANIVVAAPASAVGDASVPTAATSTAGRRSYKTLEKPSAKTHVLFTEELPDSSDEEKESDGAYIGASPGESEAVNADSSASANGSPHGWAACPLELWPVTLPFPPIAVISSSSGSSGNSSSGTGHRRFTSIKSTAASIQAAPTSIAEEPAVTLED